MGGKVKLYGLKKEEAKNANAVEVNADPNTYSIELQIVVMTYFYMPY